MRLVGEFVVGGATFRLRYADPTDDEFLQAVFTADKAAELGVIDSPDPLHRVMLAQQWAARSSGYSRAYPHATQLIATEDRVRIGQLLLDVARSEEIRVVDIAIVTKHRGRGIGAALLRHLTMLSEREGLPVRLRVVVGNPAIRLYRRAGFVVAGRDDAGYELEWRPAGSDGRAAT